MKQINWNAEKNQLLMVERKQLYLAAKPPKDL